MFIFIKNKPPCSNPKLSELVVFFFKAKKPSRLRKWYKDHLSFNLNPYGSSFEFRNANNPDKIQYFLWSVFKYDTDYFSPSTKEFMVNFRVENIEKTVAHLRKIGTEIIDEVTTYPMGNLYTYWIPRAMQSNCGKPMMTFLMIWWDRQTNKKKAGHKPDSVVPYHWSRPNITAGLYPPTHQLKSASFKHWFTWRFTV